MSSPGAQFCALLFAQQIWLVLGGSFSQFGCGSYCVDKFSKMASGAGWYLYDSTCHQHDASFLVLTVASVNCLQHHELFLSRLLRTHLDRSTEKVSLQADQPTGGQLRRNRCNSSEHSPPFPSKLSEPPLSWQEVPSIQLQPSMAIRTEQKPLGTSLSHAFSTSRV